MNLLTSSTATERRAGEPQAHEAEARSVAHLHRPQRARRPRRFDLRLLHTQSRNTTFQVIW